MKDAYRLWTPSQVAEEKFTNKHFKKRKRKRKRNTARQYSTGVTVISIYKQSNIFLSEKKSYEKKKKSLDQKIQLEEKPT